MSSLHDELKRLHEAAQPAPWRLADDYAKSIENAEGDLLGELATPEDAEIAVALRNAVPEILEALASHIKHSKSGDSPYRDKDCAGAWRCVECGATSIDAAIRGEGDPRVNDRRCPKCGEPGRWRHGLHFEHEMICNNLHSWEPGA